MKYGVSNEKKTFCQKHSQFFCASESCPWCEPPVVAVKPPTVPCDPAADQECYQCGGTGFYYAGIGTYRCHCLVGSP